jgi:hypothetical protein
VFLLTFVTFFFFFCSIYFLGINQKNINVKDFENYRSIWARYLVESRDVLTTPLRQFDGHLWLKVRRFSFLDNLSCQIVPSINVSFLTNYKIEQMRQHTLLFNCLFIYVKEHRCFPFFVF